MAVHCHQSNQIEVTPLIPASTTIQRFVVLGDENIAAALFIDRAGGMGRRPMASMHFWRRTKSFLPIRRGGNVRKQNSSVNFVNARI
jgi:hypothetical protein